MNHLTLCAVSLFLFSLFVRFLRVFLINHLLFCVILFPALFLVYDGLTPEPAGPTLQFSHLPMIYRMFQNIEQTLRVKDLKTIK